MRIWCDAGAHIRWRIIRACAFQLLRERENSISNSRTPREQTRAVKNETPRPRCANIDTRRYGLVSSYDVSDVISQSYDVINHCH